MKASVDQDGCISCGLCANTCPEVFHMNDADKAEAIDAEIPEELLELAEEARDGCPVSVIDVE